MKPVVSVTRASFTACALIAALAFCDDPTGPGEIPTTPAVRDRPLLAASAGPARIVAAGDIARCGAFLNDDSTAKLVRAVPDAAVLTLGDNVNPTNAATGVTSADYVNCYGPNWGQTDIISRTYPSPGELDWTATNGGAPYLGYFGGKTPIDPAGPDGAGYYSYDVGDWHIIALNSHIAMDTASVQYKWLKKDLALNSKECTLAYWHLPRFASYGTTPVRGSVKPLWDALYAAGADVVLNGHLRGYERFKPQRPDSTYDPQYGVRQFLVGTGGIMESAPVTTRLANSEAVIERVNGVLVMTLDAGTYSWQFQPRGGKTLPAPESGSGTCHTSPLPSAKTGGPYQSEGTVLFDGRMSTDPQRDAIVAYEWDFGDGTTGTGATVSHTYSSDGEYTATLTVTDANGDKSEAAATQVTIQNFAPVVDAGVDQWAHAGTAIEVRAHVTDLGTTDAPWSYTISWGDGATSQGTTPTLDNPLTASHAYAADGEYIATVSVTDKDGGLGTDRLTVTVSSTTAPAQVFVGAGDIGTCTSTDDDATAKLLDGIPGTVFTVGDNVYPDGKAEEYAKCYEPSWGRHKGRTFAAMGNHEYNTPDATPTFDYFGPRIGPRGKAYYSYDLGAWHVVVLNSNDDVVPTAAGSAQHQWLKEDLAASNKRCTIAIWHHPRFYSTTTGEKGHSNKQKAFWDELYAAGVELVLVGHNHHYERFRKQTPSAEPDDQYGVRQFIIGTGGDGGGKPIKSWENTEALSGAIGVLKFTLEPDKYSWEFVPIPGETFSDEGSATCHDPKSTEPENTDPVANADQYAVDEDNILTVATTVSAPGTQSVLGNDLDADGDALTASLVAGEGPTNGALDLNADGTFTYTPKLNFHGTDAFMYQVSDGKGGTATATVTIGVASVNDAPVATDDPSYSVAEDQPLTTTAASGVLANDSDVDDAELTAELVNGPSSGELSLNADGSFTYTPNANFNGTDSFQYRASDGSLGSNTATVTISVTGVNKAPVAVDDAGYSVAEDQTLTTAPTAGVLANDSDSDGDALGAELIEGPAPAVTASFTLNPNGTFSFQPVPEFFGTTTFTYRATDGTAVSGSATVTITVTAVNDAPVANAQSASTAEDTPVSISLTGSDLDGDALTFTIVSGPARGSLSAAASPGEYTYTPEANFTGSDEFTFTVADGSTTSAPATVTISVGGVNDAPVAVNDAASVAEDTPLTIGVLLNDSDPDGDQLTSTLVDGPAHGTVATNPDGSFTYTPAQDFSGDDQFTYTANDGTASSNAPATVTITVTPVNDAPVAAANAYTTSEDAPLTIPALGVLANDSDVDGDGLSAVLVSGPTNGTLTLNADGSFTYTPSANFSDSDGFTYQASDGTLQSGLATVTITVTATNDAPVARAQSVTTNEDTPVTVTLAGEDTEGSPLTYRLISQPSHGTLSGEGNVYTYTAAADYFGDDAFSFVVNDGTEDSQPATVSIGVSPVNDSPVANSQSVSTVEDTPVSITLTGSDIDGDVLSFAVTTGPTNGSLSPTATPGTYTYTPNANFNGPDAFTFTASDGTSSASATVTIDVGTVNDAPIAGDDQYDVDEDNGLAAAGVQGVLANDTDPDGDPLTTSLIAGRGPSHGTLTFNANGTFTYTPNQNFHGLDGFSYETSDGKGGTATATVAITVNPINDGPAAADDLGYSVTEDQTLTTTAATGVLANDTDVDDAQLTATVVTPPTSGTLTLNADGSFTYRPNGDFNGPDSFEYQVSDGRLTSNNATVTISVIEANDAPVAADDESDVVEDTPRVISVLANDSDAEGTPLTPELVAGEGPANGSVSVNADGTFTYTPNADFNGTDGFSYTVSDGSAVSSAARVAIKVAAVNDAPVARPQSVATDEDKTVTITLAGQDVENSQLTYSITAQPSHGTLSGEGTVHTYTPDANYGGPDAFSFVVNDGTDESGPATVSITVIVVNDIPTATADQYTLDEDNVLTVGAGQSILANDTDVDGDALSASLSAGQGPSNGTLDLNADGTFTYAPGADFHGTDAFTYQASDGNGGTSSSTVTITVNPVNDAPSFVKGADETVSEDAGPQTVPGWATQISAGGNEDGQTVNVTVTNDNAALFSVQPDIDPVSGNLVYTPAANAHGTATVTVTLRDDGGTANGGVNTSAPQTFAIIVSPVNDGPTAAAESYTTAEDVALSPAAPGLLANDSDLDGDPLTATLVVPPSHGSLTLNADGSFSYTPAANFNGSDSFTYRVSDGVVESAPATATITVTPLNDRPVATADSYTVDEDKQLTVGVPGVLANDIDPDAGQTLRTVLVSGPTNGTLILNEDGSLTYTPNLHFSGDDAFTYRTHDGVENSEVATVSITVKARMLVTLDIIPGSSTNSIGYSSSQTQIVYAIVSSATFDATLVEPGSVRLGDEKGTDTPLARNADGSFKFMLVDTNGDGRRDFYAYVNKAELKANGDLTLTTTSMTVLGGLKAPRTELFRGRDRVTVVP